MWVIQIAVGQPSLLFWPTHTYKSTSFSKYDYQVILHNDNNPLGRVAAIVIHFILVFIQSYFSQHVLCRRVLRNLPEAFRVSIAGSCLA